MDINKKQEIISIFCKLPTSNIADAMAQLNIPCSVVKGLVPLSLEQDRAAGFAVTVKQMQRHQCAEGKNLATHMEVIDNVISNGDLLVIDVGGRLDVCSGGALLALRAKMRGASGYVINGCLRDVKEILHLQFPVYFLGGSPIKSSQELQTVGVNIPVEIGSVQINPGDFIVFDDTGIVVIPTQHLEEIMTLAEKIMKKEAAVENLVRAGCGVAEAFAKTAK